MQLREEESEASDLKTKFWNLEEKERQLKEKLGKETQEKIQLRNEISNWKRKS